METISSREFSAHLDRYLDMAEDQDVCIQKGQKVFRVVYEPPVEPQVVLQPDDDLKRAISADEFRKKLMVVLERVDKKYAKKCE
jgi:hypothetical protein